MVFRVDPTGAAEANLSLYLNLRPIPNYLDRWQFPLIEARFKKKPFHFLPSMHHLFHIIKACALCFIYQTLCLKIKPVLTHQRQHYKAICSIIKRLGSLLVCPELPDPTLKHFLSHVEVWLAVMKFTLLSERRYLCTTVWFMWIKRPVKMFGFLRLLWTWWWKWCSVVDFCQIRKRILVFMLQKLFTILSLKLHSVQCSVL